MHLVGIGVAENLHQRRAAAGMGREDQPALAGGDASLRGELRKGVVDESLQRSGFDQRGERVSLGLGSDRIMMPPRKNHQRRRRPADLGGILRIGEVEAAGRQLVAHDVHPGAHTG